MEFESHNDVVAFLKGSGETDALAAYESLENVYGDSLEQTMTIKKAGDAVQYRITVEHPIEQKGMRSGKGTQLLSRLLGRKRDVEWPQEFSGEVDYSAVPEAYRPYDAHDDYGL